MKTSITAVLSLAALLSLASGSAFAADVTATQQAAIKQEVLQMLHGMLAAEERLDADAVWAVHADVPGYWWADVDGKLYDFAGTKKSWADYYITCAKLKFTTKQEEVLVLGPDLAYYLWHGAADITGKDGTVSHVDPWTARYLCRRINGAWKIVGGQDSSLPPQTADQNEAAIRQEVTQAMKGFIAAAERLDLEGALQFRADVPEFSYADTDGKQYDYPAARKIMMEVFADSTALKILPQRQEISVLDPDAALVAWNGAAEFTQKDGTVLRVDPYNITFLFKRLGGSWKIVRQHESALPPQPVKPAALPPPAAPPR